MRRNNKSRSGVKTLYDPKVQLESLPAIETHYQVMIAFLARCLPGAVALFAAITLLEGATGTLSAMSGRAWLKSLNRVPSSIGGQGNLSASAIVSMVSERVEAGPLEVLITGDSVFSPNLGGGTGNEMSIEETLSSQIPASLNIAQEGGEWGTSALLIRRLSQLPEIQAAKPLLVFNVNFKFFGGYSSFSPAFPIEMELCSETWTTGPGGNAQLCESLSRDWPGTLGGIARTSSFLTRGLLGQFDFFLTFLQRAPVYQANLRGWGFHPLRTFRSGLADGRSLASDYRQSSPAMHFHYNGREGSMNNYLNGIHGAFLNSGHPKHHWLAELSRAVAAWPGPALGLWVAPSPEAYKVFNESTQAKIEEMGQSVRASFQSHAKADLTFMSSREVLPDPYDYGDSDHPSPQGHRKLAQLIQSIVSKKGGAL